jgi:hypothetical protein
MSTFPATLNEENAKSFPTVDLIEIRKVGNFSKTS